jgi:BTB/POZ domain
MADHRSAFKCDVRFLVGPEKHVVQANKFGLAYNSSVFQRMFFSDFPSESEIVVPDVDADAFQVMIDSISGRDVQINADNIAHVYYAAEKYDLMLLRRVCKAFLANFIDTTNAMDVLNRFHHYNESDIYEKCLSIILDDPLTFFGKAEFLKAPADVIRSISKSTSINCSTEDIKGALANWLNANRGESGVYVGINQTEALLESIENRLQIKKEELLFKSMRQNLFHQYKYSKCSKHQIETSFELGKGPLFLHGFGLILGIVSDERVEFSFYIGNKYHSIPKITLVKKGPKELVSIQDVFIKKIPITTDSVHVVVKFDRQHVERSCIQFNNQDNFVSYLIVSK